jgi:hypothetical protein
MFGKPAWFRPKTIGFGLVPVAWQGWAYTAGWITTIVLPFLLLLGRHQAIEAMAWMGLALMALAYDVRQIWRGFRPFRPSPAASKAAPPQSPPAQQKDHILYILDSQPGQPVATGKYALHVGR